MVKSIKIYLLGVFLSVSMLLAGCGANETPEAAQSAEDTSGAFQSAADISIGEIPQYTSEPYVEVHDNIPFFTENDKTTDSFEHYSDLDRLGRCQAASACLGQDLMPTEKRGDISEVHPTGWQSVKYDFVDGESLYNRCHLIAFELAGENANEKNLITGTRSFNTQGMLPFENLVADYIKETDHHVLYRVTPLFTGENLVADGVVMEAQSVEDDEVSFCVYCYNVEPGVVIDYATGDNWPTGEAPSDIQEPAYGTELTDDENAAAEKEAETEAKTEETPEETPDETGTYILNTNTMKFHDPSCAGVADISERNKEEYTGSRDDLIRQGYEPCGSCNP